MHEMAAEEIGRIGEMQIEHEKRFYWYKVYTVSRPISNRDGS